MAYMLVFAHGQNRKLAGRSNGNLGNDMAKISILSRQMDGKVISDFFINDKVNTAANWVHSCLENNMVTELNSS